jgi:predicted DNA-binding protein
MGKTMLINLPKELEERLIYLAQNTKQTPAFYIQEALEEFLDSHEEYLSSSFNKNLIEKDELKKKLKEQRSRMLKPPQ